MADGDGSRIGSAWLQRRKQLGLGQATSFLYQNGVDSAFSRTLWSKWFFNAQPNGGLIIPITEYPPSTLQTNALAIPDFSTHATAALLRKTSSYTDHWTSAAVEINLTIDVSLDAGVTWKTYGGCTATGDVYPARRGAGEAPATQVRIKLPAGTGRLFRVNAVIVGGSVKSGLAVTFSSKIAGPVVYTTNFSVDENPISEGGRWQRNQANQWTNVATSGGLAHGTNGVTDMFDDSYAYLTGYGNDYEVAGTVFVNAAALVSGISTEIELLLRMTDSATFAKVYEVDIDVNGNLDGVTIWNSFGNFTSVPVTGTQSLGRQFQTGDTVRARIQGSSITVWFNDVVVGTATDSTLPTGAPGMGFFIRPGVSNAAFGLTHLTVTPL